MIVRTPTVRHLVAAGLALTFAPAVGRAAQLADTTALPKQTARTPPRTPWGDPDLQGIWPSGEMTGVPLQRPERFGERAVVTDEEFAERQAQLVRSYERFVIGAWGEQGKAQRQASLIVDPPNGRIPPLTPEGQQRSALMKSSWQYQKPTATYDGPEDFDTWDRCITRGLLPSMLPAQYNNGMEIYQSPGYVVIHIEMIHEARIIPVNGRPHLLPTIKAWLGDSRGHWEGDRLVVETTNFNGKTAATNPGTSGSPMDNNVPTSESLRIVERFSRVDDDTIDYEATVDDPTIFTRTWKVAFPLRRNPDYRIYEYACHENNYALTNFIRASQFQRAQKPKP